MKIDDYDLTKENQQLIDFKDDVTTILNRGKVQASVVRTAPTFAGNPGESVLLLNGTQGRLYYYTSGAWDVVASFTAST